MVTDSMELALVQRIAQVDHADETQIIQLLAGELVEEYVYSFKDSAGRIVEGLSWAGIREYAGQRGNIMLEEPIVEEREDHWRVMVRVLDLERNIAIWGGTHQPKFMVLKSGELKPDPFAFEKALSKAQRNAIKNLLPVSVTKAAIAGLRNGSQGQAGRKAQRQIEEPKPTPRVTQVQLDTFVALAKRLEWTTTQLSIWFTEQFGRGPKQITQAQGVTAIEKLMELLQPVEPAKETEIYFAGIEEPGEDASPQTFAELYQWAEQYEMTKAQVWTILGVTDDSQIGDLAEAWRRIKEDNEPF